MIRTMLFGLMGCAPRYAELEPMAPQDLWAPGGPVLHRSIDGVDVAYIDNLKADAPTLLFVHGLSSYMSFWEYQIPAFQDDYRVIAVDLPGYGASGRPDAPYTPPWYADLLASFLVDIGVEKATWIGHSMGGQISMTAALRHPDQVERLVLAAPAGFERFTAGEVSWMKNFWTEDRAMTAREEEIRANFTVLNFNRTDEGVERLIRERVQLGRHPAFKGTSVAVARSIAGMVDHPVIDRLAKIKAPTLIIFGTDDRMIPNQILHGGRTRAIAEAGHRGIPSSELVMIQGAGHTVQHDAGDAFNDAMQQFLGRSR
jgi:pimeloyl-ACP methyl ester carboxylesterase